MHGSKSKIPSKKNPVRQRCMEGFNSSVKGLIIQFCVILLHSFTYMVHQTLKFSTCGCVYTIWFLHQDRKTILVSTFTKYAPSLVEGETTKNGTAFWSVFKRCSNSGLALQEESNNGLHVCYIYIICRCYALYKVLLICNVWAGIAQSV
jgi:hypothetical protein